MEVVMSDDYIIRRGIFFNVNIHDGYDHNVNFEKHLLSIYDTFQNKYGTPHGNYRVYCEKLYLPELRELHKTNFSFMRKVLNILFPEKHFRQYQSHYEKYWKKDKSGSIHNSCYYNLIEYFMTDCIGQLSYYFNNNMYYNIPFAVIIYAMKIRFPKNVHFLDENMNIISNNSISLKHCTGFFFDKINDLEPKTITREDFDRAYNQYKEDFPRLIMALKKYNDNLMAVTPFAF